MLIPLKAGEKKDFPYIGSNIYLVTASDPIEVSVDGRDYFLEEGDSLEGLTEFYRVTIKTKGAGDQDIELFVSDVKFVRSPTAGAVSLKADSNLAGLAPLVWSGAGAKSVATNANRKRITLKADGSNTSPIFVGSTDATKGIPLDAGESITETVTGAIDFYCAGSADSLHVMEAE